MSPHSCSPQERLGGHLLVEPPSSRSCPIRWHGLGRGSEERGTLVSLAGADHCQEHGGLVLIPA